MPEAADPTMPDPISQADAPLPTDGLADAGSRQEPALVSADGAAPAVADPSPMADAGEEEHDMNSAEVAASVPTLASVTVPSADPPSVGSGSAEEGVSAAEAAALTELRRQLSEARAALADDRAEQFARRLRQLALEGRLLPADLPALEAAGRAGSYDLALLAPFERLPADTALPTRPRGRALFPRPLGHDRVTSLVQAYQDGAG